MKRKSKPKPTRTLKSEAGRRIAKQPSHEELRELVGQLSLIVQCYLNLKHDLEEARVMVSEFERRYPNGEECPF